MPRKQGYLASSVSKHPPCLRRAAAAASAVCVCSRCQFQTAGRVRSQCKAEISPGLDLAGKGRLTLSSEDGKHLSRAQFQCMDLWLRTEILLVFSRLAEYIGVWMKA